MTTGYDSLVVQFAWGQSPTTNPASLTWTNETAQLWGCSITRGRDSELDQVTPAEVTIVLKNLPVGATAARYTPGGSGAHSADTLPCVPVQILASDSGSVQRKLFTGFVKPRGGWQFDDVGTVVYGQATVSCTDRLGLLSNVTLPATTLAAGSTDALLSEAEALTTSWHMVLDSGRSFCSAVDTTNMNALAFIQSILDTEGIAASVQVSAAGSVVFHNRYTDIQQTPTVTFDTVVGGSNVVYLRADHTSAYVDPLYNSAEITRQNTDQLESFSNSTAATDFTTITSRVDTFLDNAAEAQAKAQAVVNAYKDATFRPKTLKLSPRKNSSHLDTALTVTLREPVTVNVAGAGHTCFVEKITHSIDAHQKSWETTFTFTDAEKFYNLQSTGMFTLDVTLLDDASSGLAF